MSIIRPRLTDFHNIAALQQDVEFAIPFLDEDIPLYVDPFLLWKSSSQQDNSLHLSIINSFNHARHLFVNGKEKDATNLIIRASECNEVGLGGSKTKEGKRIGEQLASNILGVFRDVPQINKSGFVHFEEIQLLVNNFSKDRVSDIACNFIKSFLIDYTIEQANLHKIPIEKVTINNLYNQKTYQFGEEDVYLPVNHKKNPILFVPKRWLRFMPWINPDDYFKDYYVKNIHKEGDSLPDRIKLLSFNRHNYDQVKIYTSIKERRLEDCKNDPLFSQIPVTSAKRKFSTIKALPSGKTDNADKKYEDNVCQLMASLLYPHLDFAQEQSRTVSGVHIRDLIFYNNKSLDFLKEIYDQYSCEQIVMELKNVKKLESEHVDQLNRYLSDQFGKFGVIITRNSVAPSVEKNIIDLWSGQRKCILVLTDEDLKMMTGVFESKQRDPVEVLKKKYVEFVRKCPS
jgi:hypothetical protein